jgi:DNA-binding transcriptional LysR family regulator
MELSDLRIFLAVAGAGGITRAAQELHTVQSNISARLAALERELGAPLFRRHPRGVSLTNAGEQLLPYARRISELTEEARRSIGDDAAPSGPLRIGCLETTAGLRLPAVLSSFTADCPAVDLSLVTGPTEQLTEEVLAYRLDGALVTGPLRHPELTGTAMFVEELVLLTARWVVDLDSALLATDGPRVLVFRTGCSYRARLEQVLTARGVAGAKLLEYGTLEGILGCVGAGLGITLLPRGVVERHLADGRVRAHALTEPESRAETIFIRRRDTKSPPALTRFVEHLIDAGQPPVLHMVGGGHDASG